MAICQQNKKTKKYCVKQKHSLEKKAMKRKLDSREQSIAHEGIITS